MTLPAGRATNALAVVCVLIFLLLFLTDRVNDAAVMGGFIPARVNSPDLLAGMAAVPWWLTPLTCTLIHAGWLHIGFNMLMLVFCGRQVEHVLGWKGTLVLYGVGAYAACLAQWAIGPSSTDPMVGASGAISAIIATYALLYSQQQVRRIGPLSANLVRMLWLAAAWITLQVMIGVAGGAGLADIGRIAVAAHIGGFLAGLALTRPLLLWRFRRKPHSVQ
ncbi:rhomboid family intramembrane serine protease [Sphingobium amiense]|uniref:Rhomboid family intramembrane serine protease n=1 Tax=Sphingobium amiense TaxID=135719 RepID=A0A494W609_9SPHN|nr:rhomboid family intramembrane serine protease [Sphingobium amiense]BBD97987.1 rhomboid family intramembrane serine protease [Sphingobium amiense]